MTSAEQVLFSNMARIKKERDDQVKSAAVTSLKPKSDIRSFFAKRPQSPAHSETIYPKKPKLEPDASPMVKMSTSQSLPSLKLGKLFQNGPKDAEESHDQQLSPIKPDAPIPPSKIQPYSLTLHQTRAKAFSDTERQFWIRLSEDLAQWQNEKEFQEEDVALLCDLRKEMIQLNLPLSFSITIPPSLKDVKVKYRVHDHLTLVIGIS